MRPIPLAAAALVWAAAAQAEAPLGTVSAELDGTARAWVITAEADGGQSWVTETGPVIGAGIWAVPEGASGPVEDVLDITLSAVAQGGTTVLASAEVRMLTSDLSTYYSATEDALDVTLDRLEPGPDGLAVAGSFAGRLARTTFADGAEISDPGDLREISGRFEALLPRE